MENDRKIHDRHNLLYINKKEETYYRAFNSSKSIINLTIVSLTVAPELEWSKEYELKEIDHFFIIIEEEREVSTNQQTDMEHRKSKLDAISEREHTNKHNRRST